MPDENKFEQDIEWYKLKCKAEQIPFNADQAEDFAYSVASRIVEGQQAEEQARENQFKSMWGARERKN